MTTIWRFRCERLGPRRYKTFWSEGATMFHRTFKDAKARHDLYAARVPDPGIMVAEFVDCPKMR